MRALRLACALAAAAALAACGGDDGDGSAAPDAPSTEADPAAGSDSVTISDFTYEPESLEVAAGTEVEVVNDDDAAHTLTADDGAFDTGDIAGGESATVTVEGSGEVPYHCTIHDYMRGTLVVG